MVWHIAGPDWHRQRVHNPLATLWLPPPDFLDRESTPLFAIIGHCFPTAKCRRCAREPAEADG